MSITRINTNSDALFAASQIGKLQSSLSKSIAHLSSGLRITTGADDPSGVSMANTFSTQLSGIKVASQGVQDALSLMAHADSALNESQDILRRMRDLAVKASNDSVVTATDRAGMDTEFQALFVEIDRRTSSVNFNTKALLDGTYTNKIVQAGPDNNAAYQISITLSSPSTANLGMAGAAVATQAGALAAIDLVQSGLNIISSMQANIAVQEVKLQHVINDLSSQEVNMAAAKSRITDADMAAEIQEFTRLQVLTQAATAMLAQANLQPQTALKLLGL